MLERLKTLLKKPVWDFILPSHTDELHTARYCQRLHEISTLHFDEARRQLEHLLTDPQKFDCTATIASSDLLSPLAPGLQSLFSRFRRVEIIDSEAVLDRDSVSPFGWGWKKDPRKFWQIGTDSEYDTILVKPYQEGIYDTGELDNYLKEPNYPSVYHWLLTEYAHASDFNW